MRTIAKELQYAYEMGRRHQEKINATTHEQDKEECSREYLNYQEAAKCWELVEWHNWEEEKPEDQELFIYTTENGEVGCAKYWHEFDKIDDLESWDYAGYDRVYTKIVRWCYLPGNAWADFLEVLEEEK